jgi:hypothetical protein
VSKSITTKDFFVLNTLTPEELITAQEEFNKIQPCLERKLKATYDNLMIAGTLSRVRDKHGRNSTIYNNFVQALGQFDEEWSDKDFRLKWVEAYKGYEALPGCEADKEFIFKLNPSRAALRQIRFLPSTGNRHYNILKELKSVSEFPSAAAVERYGKYGSFTPKPSLPSSSASVLPGGNTTIATTQSEVIDESTYQTITPVEVVENEIPISSTLLVTEDDLKSPIGDFNSPDSTTTEPTVSDELKALYNAYERLIQTRYKEIKDDPKALAIASWFTSLNQSYLKLHS